MSRWLEVTVPADLHVKLIAEGFESYAEEDGEIILYLPHGDEKSLESLRRMAPGLMVRERREEEWADNWKRYYKPTPIGDRLLIQPAWAEPVNPQDRAVYLNDPGMSFGTGLHASTRLCLEMLESVGLTGKRVLDIGCGSGILGLCALLLGAERAFGTDIDRYAVRTAIANAVLNGVEDRYEAEAGDFLDGGSAEGFDLVFSNIIADVIIPLVPIISKSKALWVASGIIEHRLDEILDAAEGHMMDVRAVRVEDGWAAVMLR
jgi:ribosomal protein L11 methyltransferase